MLLDHTQGQPLTIRGLEQIIGGPHMGLGPSIEVQPVAQCSDGHGSLYKAEVEISALAGGLPVVQRCQHGDHGIAAADHVSDG